MAVVNAGNAWWTGGTGGRLFPPESGRLYVDRKTLRTSSGSLFSWRGYSWFLGPLRFQDGEDVMPDIRWMLANGVNKPRCFGPLPWVELGGRYTYQTFNFYKFDELLRLLGDNGIRMNFCAAPGEPGVGLTRYLNQIYEICDAHWNVVVERVNEPDMHKKCHPLNDWFGVNTRNVLEAYGYYPYDNGRTLDNCPVRHFLTVHLPRKGSDWTRKARDAKFLQDYYEKPCISDEPAKICEPDFVGSDIKNDWATTPDEASWHFGVCHLWGPGGTVHTQHGRNGRVPEPGTLTQAAVDAVRENVWKKLGRDVQLGGYMGSHFSSSPVDGTTTSEGEPVWTYSSVHEHDAYSVRCYASAPQPKNGWREVARWGRSGEFVQLAR